MKKIKDLFIKKVPIKNYIIVLSVSLLVVVFSLYIREFYLNYKENASNTTIFYDKSIKQVDSQDIVFSLSEMSDAILYVSYTGNNNISKNEKTLFKEINKKNLTEKVVYWNVTDLLNDNKYLTILKEKFPNIENQISVAPLFIYVKSGEAVEAMSSELKYVDVNVFNKLVDKYDIE